MSAPLQIMGTTPDGRPVVSGTDLFVLKDTLGFPLSASFAECARRGLEIDWVGLIESARTHGWWDFQILDEVAAAFADSGVWAERRAEIERRLRCYIFTHRHPALAA